MRHPLVAVLHQWVAGASLERPMRLCEQRAPKLYARSGNRGPRLNRIGEGYGIRRSSNP